MSLGIFSIISCFLCNSLSGDFEMSCMTKCCPAGELASDENQSILVLNGIVQNTYLMLVLIKYLLGAQVLNEKAPSGPFITYPCKLFPRS